MSAATRSRPKACGRNDALAVAVPLPLAVAAPLPLAVAAPLKRQTDDELMRLARDGVDSAFEELVRRYQGELLRVAARHLGSSALAPDLVQNAFLQVYGALDRYEARGTFRAYLHRVLLNQCRMAHRSARVALKALEHSELVQGCNEPKVFEREQLRDLERAIGCLSEKLRDVVVLRYCGDLDYEEVAQTLALPLGTVKRRLFDAMAKLREIVEPR